MSFYYTPNEKKLRYCISFHFLYANNHFFVHNNNHAIIIMKFKLKNYINKSILIIAIIGRLQTLFVEDSHQIVRHKKNNQQNIAADLTLTN